MYDLINDDALISLFFRFNLSLVQTLAYKVNESYILLIADGYFPLINKADSIKQP